MGEAVSQTNEEFTIQKVNLIRSITRALALIHSMQEIGEREEWKIQEFIVYNIPRCPLLFQERQQFRNTLKNLSIGKLERKQAIDSLVSQKYRLTKMEPVLQGAQ
jgi:hypothetical protein